MPQLAAFAYDLDDGLMGRRTAVIELQQDRAVPDGLCVDDDGCVWVALWGAGAVHRYTPDGRLDTIVSVAAEQVTSCAFGGSGLATLFITTARSGLAPEEAERQPLAGSVFAVEPGVTGPAAVPWRPVG
jgi:sugar lactone lactonase YvrE